MHYLPLYVNPSSLNFVVIGAGSVAARKVEMLINAGIKPQVISLQAEAEIEIWHQ
ncbi:NAD(P)-dependent oxidoreductase [Paraferrimonas sp. SM1919]|uniref:NAD(P)-dependent oxidoreductase n=1 Tax=Paraferrimonas sp. SM1919 TaxID=2662263 RepID=UPI0013D84433|nr:NAD(P)-dependent oxidoreductase [Paraferrimonas sp. SM1919]